MANTLPSTYPTALAHPMSYRHDNFYEASTTSMTSPACKYCGYAVCQCGYVSYLHAAFDIGTNHTRTAILMPPRVLMRVPT